MFLLIFEAPVALRVLFRVGSINNYVIAFVKAWL